MQAGERVAERSKGDTEDDLGEEKRKGGGWTVLEELNPKACSEQRSGRAARARPRQAGLVKKPRPGGPPAAAARLRASASRAPVPRLRSATGDALRPAPPPFLPGKALSRPRGVTRQRGPSTLAVHARRFLPFTWMDTSPGSCCQALFHSRRPRPTTINMLKWWCLRSAPAELSCARRARRSESPSPHDELDFCGLQCSATPRHSALERLGHSCGGMIFSKQNKQGRTLASRATVTFGVQERTNGAPRPCPALPARPFACGPTTCRALLSPSRAGRGSPPLPSPPCPCQLMRPLQQMTGT